MSTFIFHHAVASDVPQLVAVVNRAYRGGEGSHQISPGQSTATTGAGSVEETNSPLKFLELLKRAALAGCSLF